MKRPRPRGRARHLLISVSSTLAFALLAPAQNAGSASAKGSCIIANTGSNSKINQTCTIVEPELFNEFRAIADATRGNAKLLKDLVLQLKDLRDKLKSSPLQVLNAPGGFAISGGTQVNPTVNNYSGLYPPPGVAPTISICASRLETPPGQDIETALRITTDTAISEPAWWFLFDGPVVDATVDVRKEPMGYAHDHPPHDKIPYWQNVIGVTILSFGFSQKPWRPDVPLRIIVTSKQPIKLLEVHGRSLDLPLEEKVIFACQ